MKNIVTLLVTILLVSNAWSQSSQKMSYQAVIRDAGNNLVKSQSVGIRISILKGSASGTVVYSETQAPVTNSNGLLSIEFGSATGFDTINWQNGPYFIKTETDPAGSANYTISGTSQLLSVPYALYAQKAGNAFSHYIGELYQGGIIVSVWKENSVEHGLIASLTDVSAGIAWSNMATTAVGTTAQSSFDGKTNTTAIIGQAGHTASAAKLCDDYANGGYTDWYLPSLWELKQCFNAAYIVNTVLGEINGFKFDWYWSSTEVGDSWVYGVHFSSGGDDSPNKTSTNKVRAIRKF